MKYQICARCVMDTTATGIRFDDNGVCNYCTEFFNYRSKHQLDEKEKPAYLEELLNKIKDRGKSREYDCVIGVSGGLDSSYTLYMVKKFGLRPLAVHLDNGWNTELSANNVQKLCGSLGVDLHTHVIDWEEFKDLQISFFKANVIDIELLTDHAIFSYLYKIASGKKIRYILSGTNFASEGMRIPSGWNHFKLDSRNIKAIYRKFGGGRRIKTFPFMGLFKYFRYLYIDKIKWISILDYLTYIKDEAIKTLSQEVGWKSYEKKHYESIFTRFYQGYILPSKYNIDKRKLHYSTLICSGQMSREEALNSIEKRPYDSPDLLNEDKECVLKKLGFDEKEFEEYLNSPPVSHLTYPSDIRTYQRLRRLIALIERIANRLPLISRSANRKKIKRWI